MQPDLVKFKEITLAVAVAKDKNGCSHKLVALNRYKRPPEEVNLEAPVLPDEIPVNGLSHAEVNIVRVVQFLSWQLGYIGATRVVCDTCQRYIWTYFPNAKIITCRKGGPALNDLKVVPH
jgi:hypothetical protein